MAYYYYAPQERVWVKGSTGADVYMSKDFTPAYQFEGQGADTETELQQRFQDIEAARRYEATRPRGVDAGVPISEPSGEVIEGPAFAGQEFTLEGQPQYKQPEPVPQE